MNYSMIFVFGSNKQGIHGGGAAFYAHKDRGAVWGVGEGLRGSSYALPTKLTPIQSLPLNEVIKSVDRFLRFAEINHGLKFQLTRVGCGLASNEELHDKSIAPMFFGAPNNCYFDTKWHPYLHSNATYWGTFP